MNYQLALLGGVTLIDGDTRISIPFSPDNTDFVEYQKWLAAGNTPIPADEPNA